MTNLNLLPPAERSAAFYKIMVHFFATVLLFVAVWDAAVLTFIGEGWIFLRIQNDALAQRLYVEKSTGVALQTKAFEDSAKKTNELLAHAAIITSELHDDDASLVALVSSLVPQGVRLHSLVVNSVSGTITIGGSADTRDEFLAFQQRLQSKTSYFTNVQSPLSNLLSPNNISFSFLISLKR